MSMKRRDFINLSAIAAATCVVPGVTSSASGQAKEKKSAIDVMQSLTGDVVPITLEEGQARIETLILDAGTSLTYFTGISWWPSERPMVAIIPAIGDVKYVCPAFEESRL